MPIRHDLKNWRPEDVITAEQLNETVQAVRDVEEHLNAQETSFTTGALQATSAAISGAAAAGSLDVTGALTRAGNTVYDTGNKPTPADIGALSSAGGTVSGTLTFPNDVGNILLGTMGETDLFRIHANSQGSNNGFLEIATGDDGSEPIRCAQYSGPFEESNKVHEITLMDNNGHSYFNAVYDNGERVYSPRNPPDSGVNLIRSGNGSYTFPDGYGVYLIWASDSLTIASTTASGIAIVYVYHPVAMSSLSTVKECRGYIGTTRINANAVVSSSNYARYTVNSSGSYKVYKMPN